MRQNGAKENLIKPLILSVVVTLLGIGLLVYYVCFSKKPSTLNYVVSGLTVAVGISLIAAAIVRLVKVKGYLIRHAKDVGQSGGILYRIFF